MTKTLQFLVPLLLVSLTVNGQIAERTLVRAFNLQGGNHVLLDVDADVNVQEWNQDQMRVMMTISLADGSEMMLKNLVKVGRYNLTSEETDGGIRVFAPGLEKQVKLRNGSALNENISLTIYAPGDVVVKSKNGAERAETADSF